MHFNGSLIQIQRVDGLRAQLHRQRRLLVQIISNASDDILLIVTANDVREKSPLVGGQRRSIVVHQQIDRSRLFNRHRVRQCNEGRVNKEILQREDEIGCFLS